jgi:hypothetical protein
MWAPFTFEEYSAELNSFCPTGVYIRTRCTCNLFDLGVRHKVWVIVDA